MAVDLLLAVLMLSALAWLYRSAAPRPATARPAATRRATLAGARGSRFYYPSLARQAGLDPETWRLDYWGAKLAGALLVPMATVELASVAGLSLGGGWLALPALVGFFVPDLVLVGLRRRRRRQVRQALAYFLDLLVALQLSGLSLMDSLRRAGREGFAGPHPLAREVALVGRELEAGQDPAVAFHSLAERTGVSELNAVASALRLGLELGAPVHSTLRSQADALWTKRREEALRKIHRAEIQVLFPLVLSSFPVFGVLAFFPIIMDLLDALRSFSGLLE